jgi:tetratricopeptide (TPR) repeat protein
LIRVTEALNSEQAAKTLAQDNFVKARDAVDAMLSRVGDERLRDMPHMEQLRRALLEEALVFNESFLREQGEDREVRSETARAYQRAGDIHDLLGQHDQAEHDYGKTIELLETIVHEHPDDRATRSDLAVAHNHRAIVLASLDQHDKADRDFDRAQDLQLPLDGGGVWRRS